MWVLKNINFKNKRPYETQVTLSLQQTLKARTTKDKVTVIVSDMQPPVQRDTEAAPDPLVLPRHLVSRVLAPILQPTPLKHFLLPLQMQEGR